MYSKNRIIYLIRIHKVMHKLCLKHYAMYGEYYTIFMLMAWFKLQSRQPTVCCYCCASTTLPGRPGLPTIGFKPIASVLSVASIHENEKINSNRDIFPCQNDHPNFNSLM